MKFKKISSILFFVAALGMVLFFLGGSSRAFGQGFIPFGGRILLVTRCCNGTLITVGPPRPGNFLITLATRIYAHYNVFVEGPWVLGVAVPPGNSSCWLPPTCRPPMATMGIITKIGSSRF